jgi:hypothetical protein
VPPVAIVVNVAVTVRLALPVRIHGRVPAHPPPLHPSKRDPEPGVAVSVTTVAPGKDSVQSLPQLIPAGALLIVPVPVPDLFTVRASVLRVVVLHDSFE